MRRNIPYVKYGGLKFLESAHVKDLLAVLRWADNPRHRIAAFRVLQLLPGMGPANAQRCLRCVRGRRLSMARVGSAHGSRRHARTLDTARCSCCASIGDAAAPWEGQVARVREWYEPQLDAICTRRRRHGAAISTSSNG